MMATVLTHQASGVKKIEACICWGHHWKILTEDAKQKPLSTHISVLMLLATTSAAVLARTTNYYYYYYYYYTKGISRGASDGTFWSHEQQHGVLSAGGEEKKQSY